MSEKPITLGLLAERAGCSRSTVSRALRNHPQISKKTCERIQKLAKELGWKPDPEASRLMSYLQQSKSQRIESTLALLNDFSERELLQQGDYTRTLIDAARARAEELGFRLEEIWLKQKGMTPKRVDGILRARGIHGVLIPPEQNPLPRLDLDWSAFAAVATTTTSRPERMNRVLPDNYFNMRMLMKELKKRGVKRPFLVSDIQLETRMEHAPTAIFLSSQVQEGYTPIKPFYWDDPELKHKDNLTELKRALDAAQPDHLMVVDQWVLDLLGDHPYDSVSSYANVIPDGLGVDQQPAAIGRAAVDVLSAHVIRGEHGLRGSTRVLHIRGKLVG